MHKTVFYFANIIKRTVKVYVYSVNQQISGGWEKVRQNGVSRAKTGNFVAHQIQFSWWRRCSRHRYFSSFSLSLSLSLSLSFALPQMPVQVLLLQLLFSCGRCFCHFWCSHLRAHNIRFLVCVSFAPCASPQIAHRWPTLSQQQKYLFIVFLFNQSNTTTLSIKWFCQNFGSSTNSDSYFKPMV